MNRDALDRWCKRGIFGVVLAILIFGSLATGAVRTLEFLVIQALTIIAVVLWLVRIWIKPHVKLFWPSICWAMLAFTCYALIRYFTADIEYVARQEWIRVLIYGLLFLMIINNFQQVEFGRAVVLVLVFLAMGISGYAIYQFATKSSHVWHFVSPYTNRGMGTYINPNHLAGFLEMLLPLALAFSLISRYRPVARIFIGYAALVIACGVVVSVSRGAWVATMLSLTCFALLLLVRRAYRVQAVVMLLIISCGLLVMIPKAYSVRNKLGKIYSAGHLQDIRLDLWRPAIEMWKDHLLFGVGPGHFDYRFREYRPPNVQMRPDHVHNDYLEALVNWGVVGALILSIGVGIFLRNVFGLWRSINNPAIEFGRRGSNRLAVLTGATIGLLAIFFHSFVDFNMHIPANAILAVALIGLVVAQMEIVPRRSRCSPPWMKTLYSCCLIAVVLYLSFQGVRRMNEHIWLERASRALPLSQERMAALMRAYDVEPKNFNTAFLIGQELSAEAIDVELGYEELARQAMNWYARGAKLNRHDGYNYLFYGVCLDLLGRYEEASEYFLKAQKLDPNGYFTMAYVGRHFVELGNFVAARQMFERSMRLQWHGNPLAESYLEIVNRRLKELVDPERMLRPAAEAQNPGE